MPRHVHCINSKTLHRDAMGIIVEHSVHDECNLHDLSEEDEYFLYNQHLIKKHAITKIDDTSQYVLASQGAAYRSWKLPSDE